MQSLTLWEGDKLKDKVGNLLPIMLNSGKDKGGVGRRIRRRAYSQLTEINHLNLAVGLNRPHKRMESTVHHWEMCNTDLRDSSKESSGTSPSPKVRAK